MDVGWIGLGKLGLPCALSLAQAGHNVFGFDTNPAIAATLLHGNAPAWEQNLNSAIDNNLRLAESGQPHLTWSPLHALAQTDVIFVSVPTPHVEGYGGHQPAPSTARDFEYSYLVNAVRSFCSVADSSRLYRLVIVSTVLPGTCDRLLRPLLPSNIALVYNPSFIAMGTVFEDFANPEFLLLGTDRPELLYSVIDVYRQFFGLHWDLVKVVQTTIPSAELIKVAYNCYSDDTDVMTSEGWKRFADLTGEEQILSLNPSTHGAEWVSHSPIPGQDGYSELIHFASSKEDILVTPGHRMFAALGYPYKDGKSTFVNVHDFPGRFDLVPAEKLERSPHVTFARSVLWEGESVPEVIVASYRIPIDIFARFMGWYLAKGCVSQQSIQSFSVVISQSRRLWHGHWEETRKAVADFCAIIESSFSESDSGFTFYHKHMGMYLAEFGHAGQKFVPRILKDAPPDVIRLFLDAYLAGDGCVSGATTYYATTSDRLASDLGEMLVKVGSMPSYRVTSSPLSRKPCYLVYETRSKVSHQRSISRVPYSGKVYCTRLERNHVMLTRRNGKCAWQGNTYISMKIVWANTIMEICDKTAADCDDVVDALSQADKRLMSPAYLRGGMGDGGSCLLPGEIVMSEHGPTPIEELCVGDRVLTMDGSLQPILRTMSRHYDGDVVSYSARGLPASCVTSDHPVMTRVDLRMRMSNGRKSTVRPFPRSDVVETAAGCLTSSHLVTWPDYSEEPLLLPDHATDEYLELAGWYLAEGCLELSARRGRLSFSLHIEEVDEAERIAELLAVCAVPSSSGRGGNASISIEVRPWANGRVVRFGNIGLTRLLDSDFGHGAASKRLPAWALWSSTKTASLLLEGMLKGDGHINDHGVSYSTISEHLAWGAHVLMTRLDARPATRIIDARPGHQRSFEVRVRNRTEAMRVFDSVNIPRQLEGEHEVATDDWRPVRVLGVRSYSGVVHNLHVSGTNTFVSVAGVVHNCHPRDLVALSHLTEQLNMSSDLFGFLVRAREQQTAWLADKVEYWSSLSGLPIVVLGCSYKPNVPITAGSPALLLQYYINSCEVIDYPWEECALAEPAVFIIALRHPDFPSFAFPSGSVVIDPHGFIPPRPDITVVPVGRKVV